MIKSILGCFIYDDFWCHEYPRMYAVKNIITKWEFSENSLFADDVN